MDQPKSKLKSLCNPFPADDIEWRFQQSGIKADKPWAMVLAYVTSRAIQERLDDVVGPANWCNRFDTGPGGGVICGISIKVGDEWVTKWDGAENTNIEAIKGGLSGAFKRAAVHWGIGRYLYKLPPGWAVFTEKGIYKDRIESTWYKWNPPALPVWALPEGDKGKTPAARTEIMDEEPDVDLSAPQPIYDPKAEGFYQDLVSSMQECNSVEEFTEWGKQKKAAIATLPPHLEGQFRLKAREFKATLPEKA